MLHDLEHRNSRVNIKNIFLYNDSGFFPKLGYEFKLQIFLLIFLVSICFTCIVFIWNELSNQTKVNDSQLLISDTKLNIEKQQLQVDDVDFELSNYLSLSSDFAQIPEVNFNSNSTTKLKAEGFEKTRGKPIKLNALPSIVVTNIKKITDKKKSVSVTGEKIKYDKKLQVKSTLSSNIIDSSKEKVIYKQQRKLSVAQQAEKKFRSGYQYLLQNNSELAQDELRNALMLMPKHIHARELLAGIYIKNARFVEARTLLQYGMRVLPRHVMFAKLSAQLLMNRGDNITAISILQRHPPTQAADPEYYALLAALYQKANQHHRAATLYSQLLKIRKNHGLWWLGLAISLESLGKFTEAILAFEKAMMSGTLNKSLLQYSQKRVNFLTVDEYSSVNLD